MSRNLRIKDVAALTGLSRASIYTIPGFPQSFKIGERAVAWDEEEIHAWMRERRERREAREAREAA